MDYLRLFITDHEGVRVVYSSGDSVQLPPIMMNTFYDDDVGKAGTPDLNGKNICLLYKSC